MKKLLFTLLIISCLCFSSALPANSAPDLNTETQAAPISENTSNSYSDYISSLEASVPGEGVKIEIGQTVENSPVTFVVEIPQPGLYTAGMSYKASGDEITALEIALRIDGAAPFAEAEKLLFPRYWQNEGENRTDGLGNQFAAKQIPLDDYRLSLARDITNRTDEPYLIYLQQGAHEIEITPLAGAFELEYFEFGVTENSAEYKEPRDDSEYYSGAPVILEGEQAEIKNSFWLGGKTDNSSVKITPNDHAKSLVNYIGGGNWKTAGETIIWQTPELEAGYYQLGFSFRQNAVIGGKTYRRLTVDGQSPFKQAEAIGFAFDDNWQQRFFSDEDKNPYLIYLTAGTHEIALTVVPGEVAEVVALLEEAVAELGEFYIEMTMITGDSVDVYRDYELFSQIPGMEKRLKKILKALNAADERLYEITGQKSGSNSAVIKNMAQVLEQMLKNRYTAHRYKKEYYTRYTAAASILFDLQSMPLDIDKLILTAPEQKTPFEAPGFFSQLLFSAKRFFSSFTEDYNSISGAPDSSEQITIWVNWGRDQAQVLNSLIQTSFTPQTGIAVNVQLVNASMVQAILSGKAPDCFLQHSRSEPINLAMRGVLYDLTRFEDLDETLKRFQKGAEIPYYYKDGLYALPDTQVFYLMYYRKDILNKLGLSVPKTWDEFERVTMLLARQNLSVWMPNNVATNTTQVNAGVGSNNLFPSLLMQKGISLYSEDGRSTNLSNPEVMVTFSEWTDYYRKLKIPKEMDFYNRFRTGTCPLGISTYTTYTTLKAAATEIDGLWGVSPIPGTVQKDGTTSHSSSGGGTACAVLKTSKNPEAAWEFLKWWTSEEIQLGYSNELESILGAAGRVALSNVDAFKSMAWEPEMLEPILSAWEQVDEIPEYPGSYYVSRAIYQSYWNVVDSNKTPKDMLLKYSKQADEEIARKWKQYENR